jgi:hypothetical protein
MTNKIITFGLVTILLMTAQICFAQQPLQISIKDNWKIEYTKSEKKGIYKLINAEDEKSILLLYPETVKGQQGLNGELFRKNALEQLAFIENKYKEKLKFEKYELIDITSKNFKGMSLVMKHNDGFLQCHIVVTNGTDVWDGLFNGSEKHWSDIIEMLQKL